MYKKATVRIHTLWIHNASPPIPICFTLWFSVAAISNTPKPELPLCFSTLPCCRLNYDLTIIEENVRIKRDYRHFCGNDRCDFRIFIAHDQEIPLALYCLRQWSNNINSKTMSNLKAEISWSVHDSLKWKF